MHPRVLPAIHSACVDRVDQLWDALPGVSSVQQLCLSPYVLKRVLSPSERHWAPLFAMQTRANGSLSFTRGSHCSGPPLGGWLGLCSGMNAGMHPWMVLATHNACVDGVE